MQDMVAKQKEIYKEAWNMSFKNNNGRVLSLGLMLDILGGYLEKNVVGKKVFERVSLSFHHTREEKDAAEIEKVSRDLANNILNLLGISTENRKLAMLKNVTKNTLILEGRI
jgi:hypothetical protein